MDIVSESRFEQSPPFNFCTCAVPYHCTVCENECFCFRVCENESEYVPRATCHCDMVSTLYAYNKYIYIYIHARRCGVCCVSVPGLRGRKARLRPAQVHKSTLSATVRCTAHYIILYYVSWPHVPMIYDRPYCRLRRANGKRLGAPPFTQVYVIISRLAGNENGEEIRRTFFRFGWIEKMYSDANARL